MKMRFLCKNHPYSCVIEKIIHGKMHRREVGCAIIFKVDKSCTTAASDPAGNARQHSPPKIF